MGLLALILEISSVLAGDEYANRRGQLGHLIAELATTTSGLIVVGALGYGIASEGRRLTGVAKSAVAQRVRE
jgi:hypothetical protein